MTTSDEALPHNNESNVSFSHVHLYVDHIDDILAYKRLEEKLNRFAFIKQDNPNGSIEELAQLYVSKKGTSTPPFSPHNRDIVRQLLTAFGFRITAVRFPTPAISCNTSTVLVTSRDPKGVQFVITSDLDKSHHTTTNGHSSDHYPYFDASNIRRFYQQHSRRQGIAVLAFAVQNVVAIDDNYDKMHPNLILRRFYNEEVRLLEVFAYYMADGVTPDRGTVLRFVQGHEGILPGLTPIEADFPIDSHAAYCDHWVSNVFSRTGFLQILHDTLGFTPKVDFNAGVVAAGEAQIESTVTGNSSRYMTPSMALKDQSQVYLPINNALSKVGHVYGFLHEVGQGIQHVASRVQDLVAVIQRANEYRSITGEGFTFLKIPRSYYGVLTIQQLKDGGLTTDTATAIIEACESGNIISSDGAVDLTLTEEDVHNQLVKHLRAEYAQEEYKEKIDYVLAIILKSRYCNLYNLLKGHVSEESYLSIIRNEILVDVQGEDLLYQIFTSNILQRHRGEEAPFLEFIQRVCSECKDDNDCPIKVKPGCGGFGIRNFLTLFLSIEVSKAMMEVSHAKSIGDVVARSFAQERVDCFTAQLNEANPILTDISRAMTTEGIAREKMEEAQSIGDAVEAERWHVAMEQAASEKFNGNKLLMACSSKYMDAMKNIRERYHVEGKRP